MAGKEAEKTFGELIRRYDALLYRVCRIYAHQKADREDLYQEIVLQLWKSYAGFKGNAAFSTWLYRVAINTAITGFRKHSKTVAVIGPADNLLHLPEESAGDWPEEHWRLLWAAIERLSDIDRAVLTLYLDDIPYEQMEDILGISQGTIRVRISRIKEKLKQFTKDAQDGN